MLLRQYVLTRGKVKRSFKCRYDNISDKISLGKSLSDILA